VQFAKSFTPEPPLVTQTGIIGTLDLVHRL